LSLLKDTRELLDKNGLHLSRRLGQNFLVDENVVDKILRLCSFSPADEVVEIGTGFGFLTREIAAHVKSIITFEIDRGVSSAAGQVLRDCPNVHLRNEDFLEFDLAELAGRRVKVLGNLPYNITSPVVEKLLAGHRIVKEAFIMVQKEVADRMMAAAGTREYGSFSLFCQYQAGFEKLFPVSRNCFFPRPEVDSVFLRVRPFIKPPLSVVDEKLFFNIIRIAFGQRRKHLFKLLSQARDLDVSRQQLEAAFQSLDLPDLVRGERLTLSQFATLSNHLAGKR
jgi:16S rRNA (adenine1518-N6/adenine1519-N6)-dimethyltransferase